MHRHDTLPVYYDIGADRIGATRLGPHFGCRVVVRRKPILRAGPYI